LLFGLLLLRNMNIFVLKNDEKMSVIKQHNSCFGSSYWWIRDSNSQ